MILIICKDKWVITQRLDLFYANFQKFIFQNFILSILFTWMNCTKGFHSDMSTHAHNVLLSPSPSLLSFLTVFSEFCYSYIYIIYFNHISPPSLCLFHLLLPLVTSQKSTLSLLQLLFWVEILHMNKNMPFVFLKLVYLIQQWSSVLSIFLSTI
jgi:hypothetical protein